MEKQNKSIHPVWVIFAILIVWGASYPIISYIVPESPNRGPFGDTFGAVNALFSGLAFAGLIYTILLQREELFLQREELTLTRKELQGQKEELEKQNAHWEQQRIEEAYFKLLNFYSNIEFKRSPQTRHNTISAFNSNVNNQLLNHTQIERKTDRLKTIWIDAIEFDDTYEQIPTNLFFLINYLFKTNGNELLVDHLNKSINKQEKAFLFYYLLAHDYKLKILGDQYLKSEFIPMEMIDYSILQSIDSNIFPQIRFEDSSPKAP